MNRIEKAVALVEGKLAAITEDKRATLEKAMTLDFREHVAYMEANALAYAGNRLLLEESQMVYQALGEGFVDGWPKDTSLAMKIVITQLMGELLRPKA